MYYFCLMVIFRMELFWKFFILVGTDIFRVICDRTLVFDFIIIFIIDYKNIILYLIYVIDNDII